MSRSDEHGVAAATRRLCDRATSLDLPPLLAARVADARDRLDGPLRVAIAGRIKAGKSTLLNALVGERLAPTDAGECTRIVSWYQEGLGYGVAADLVEGESRPLRFRRNGSLTVELGDLTPEQVRRLVVEWPSERLADTTLIDTPGLASLDDTVSQRTRAALAADGQATPEADVVVYLMRHLHRVDADFLEGFVGGDHAGASPVNSITVLSRADEIGAGRLDALDSARSIARAYARDDRVAALSSDVIAVSGLVAETAQTLTEAEFRELHRLVDLSDDDVASMLLSVDRFVDEWQQQLGDGDVARRLVRRFGLFGLRFASDRLRDGAVTSTADLARALFDVSGLGDLQRTLDRRIRPRAEVLQARSVLMELDAVAAELMTHDPDAARTLARALEEVMSSAHEFAELRVAHVVATGMTMLPGDETDRMAHLVAPGPLHDRLGSEPDPTPDGLRSAALTEIEHWRTAAANPLYDPVTVEACSSAARCAEGLYARLLSTE
jgi:hypothetical protein